MEKIIYETNQVLATADVVEKDSSAVIFEYCYN